MEINEKLGVPDGLIEEADRIYKLVEEELDNFSLENFEENEEEEYYEKLTNTHLDLGDHHIDNFDILIKLIYRKDISGAIMPSVGIGSKPEYKSNIKDEIYIQNLPKTSSLIFTVVGNNINEQSIKECILDNFNPSIMAHELKHVYDDFKRNRSSFKNRVEYDAYQMIPNFPDPIRRMFHLLYFISDIESLVRPTEIYKKLVDNKVTKDNFIEFMKSDKVVNMIEECENFSLDKLLSDLREDPSSKEIINMIKEDIYKLTGDNGIDILNLVFINFVNTIAEQGSKRIRSFIMEKLTKKGTNPLYFLNFISSKEEKEINRIGDLNINKLINNYMKYENNPMKFFEKIEKKINLAGRKIKRKLYKLYDMVETGKNGTILNWDLHSKINSKNENISGSLKKFTFNFKDFTKNKSK